ncbi:MAG: 50S ribosomal protein L32 [Synergistales bacterium]|nr:50S ribosomal protein L32 [Synergistales bacterium]
MAVPKRKTSRQRARKRKAQWLGALRGPSLTTCPHCGEPVETYRACNECGYYRGRKVTKGAADEDEE